eukprot:TRINITY_DN71356_c0_g1_i1.p1 TRINITY_DN71356_c0_g1~~TRINITY_DN71356_c0_g1_i1.p1  ORF type:complete len:394 (-),score=39.03 TRINITY_DN71356_c0_g1_i1:386-1567(-)
MMLCTFNDSPKRRSEPTCMEEQEGTAWIGGTHWSCHGAKPADIDGDLEAMAEMSEGQYLSPRLSPREGEYTARSNESCNDAVWPEADDSKAQGDRSQANSANGDYTGGAAVSAPECGPLVPPDSPVPTHQPESSSGTLFGSFGQGLGWQTRPVTTPYGTHPWPERLVSALPGDGRDLSSAHVHGKIPRCTARDPFWVYAKPGPTDVSKTNGKVSGLHCLHDAVSAIDMDSDLMEVPETEIMAVQLVTREQRLDWRDFLCEAVAGTRAASLFQLYDTEAEPPSYARPPPSALTPESIERWYRHCVEKRPVPCVAPEGAGLCPEGDGELVLDDVSTSFALSPRVAESTPLVSRSTGDCQGVSSTKGDHLVSPVTASSEEAGVSGDEPQKDKTAAF